MKKGYNATVNSSTGFAPQEVINGKSSLDPLERDLNIDLDKIYDKLKGLAERSRDVKNESRVSYYEYKIGDMVLLRIRNRS